MEQQDGTTLLLYVNDGVQHDTSANTADVTVVMLHFLITDSAK